MFLMFGQDPQIRREYDRSASPLSLLAYPQTPLSRRFEHPANGLEGRDKTAR
jgi:hypothetical protein